jgi:hypothetical protein
MKFPKVYIIILNWNGKNLLKDCLSSLFKLTDYPNYKVIVVDNGSSDGSVEFVKKKFPKTVVLALDKNYGFAKGNNEGIKKALNKKCKYVVTLNNDTKLTRNWLKELVRVAESDEKIGMCAPKILFMNDPKRINTTGISLRRVVDAIDRGFNQFDNGKFDKLEEIFGPCAAAALYRCKMLEEIGLFDEDYFAYQEDVDLALRARLAGWKCMYVPFSIVYHKGSATAAKFLRSPIRMYVVSKNRLSTVIKNLGISTIILYFPFFLFIELATLFTFLRAPFNFYLLNIKGRVDFLFSLNKLFKKRKKVQSLRRVKEVEIRKWMIPWDKRA